MSDSAQLPTLNGSIGFVAAGLRTVAEALEGWRRSHYWFAANPQGLRVEQIEAPLREAIHRIEPLAPDRVRELLWECNEGAWTAYFDGMLPSDVTNAISGICSVTGLRGLEVSDGDPTGLTQGGQRFLLLDGERTTRYVSVDWEGGWCFDTVGDPLPFEETERYSRRSRKERLTSEMLERYCAHLHVRPFDPSFYGTTGVLFSDIRPGRSASRG